MIYIDCQGTILSNQSLDQPDCIQAVLDIAGEGLPVELVSSLPGATLAGMKIGDKSEAFSALRLGDFLVDDEPAILRAAQRLGAIPVPAAALVKLADLLCPARRGRYAMAPCLYCINVAVADSDVCGDRDCARAYQLHRAMFACASEDPRRQELADQLQPIRGRIEARCRPIIEARLRDAVRKIDETRAQREHDLATARDWDPNNPGR